MKTVVENKSAHNSKILLGAVIFIIGCLLLVDQLDLVIIPDWVISWPLILIGIGLYNGVKHNFQNVTWIILVGIGGTFMLDEAIPGLNLDNFIWPAGLILLGIYIINKRSHRIAKEN
jgi:hypothetical protein